MPDMNDFENERKKDGKSSAAITKRRKSSVLTTAGEEDDEEGSEIPPKKRRVSEMDGKSKKRKASVHTDHSENERGGFITHSTDSRNGEDEVPVVKKRLAVKKPKSDDEYVPFFLWTSGYLRPSLGLLIWMHQLVVPRDGILRRFASSLRRLKFPKKYRRQAVFPCSNVFLTSRTVDNQAWCQIHQEA